MEQTLGKRISSNRKALGLTQDALAEQLGVTAQAVSKWENDQSCPDITMLPKLAGIFHCSVDALLGVEPVHKEIQNIPPENPEEQKDGLLELELEGGKRSKVAFALWLLLLGAYLSAGSFLQWELRLWSVAFHCGLAIFGLFGLYPHFSIFRLCCMFFGTYYLVEGTGLLNGYTTINRELVFPLLVTCLGLHLLFTAGKKGNHPCFSMQLNGKKLAGKENGCNYDAETFTCTTCFGEGGYLIELPRLSGGKGNVSFGELEIDLSGCQEIAADCRLLLESNFGELCLIVPKTYIVRTDISTAFAVVDVHGRPAENAESTIYVNGRANFGHITVQYR